MLGEAYFYENRDTTPACFAGYLIRLRCNVTRVEPEFLYSFANSELYLAQLHEGTIQATIQNFSAEKYGDIALPLPPIGEQKAIVDHITGEIMKFEKLRSAAERSIALLKERRAALIAAAVTGQIDLPASQAAIAVRQAGMEVGA